MKKNESNRASIANRLVDGFGSFFILLTVVSGGILYGIMQSRLQHDREQILRDRMNTVRSLLKSPAHGLEALRERVSKEWPTRGGEKVFVRLIDAKNEVITQSPAINCYLLESFSEIRSPEVSDSHHHLIGVRESESAFGFAEPIRIAIAVDEKQSAEFLDFLRETILIVSRLNLCISLCTPDF